MNVRDYIAHETERQSGTIQEAVGMYLAYLRFLHVWKCRWRLTEAEVRQAASFINGLDYRKVPAVFNQGMPAIPAAHVPQAMRRLGEALNSNDADEMFEDSRQIADYFTREFLLIHPFADGNGRVGSLIWNFLNGSIGDPEPMPYFFGEE